MMCYQCGKRESKIEGLCEPCFLESQPPLFFKNLKILKCRECGDFYFKSWRNLKLDDVIEEYISLRNTDFNVEENDQFYTVSVIARQKFHEKQTHPLVQQTQFFVYVRESLCTQCSKMLSGYYQAVLQVRRQGHLLTEEERGLLSDIVTGSLRKKDFISRIDERKEGTDFYFSTAKAAKRAADILKRRLGGIVRESYNVVGFDRQKCADVKRGTILFSLHRYRKGDVVFYQGSVFEVSSSEKRLHLKTGGGETVLPWKKVEHLENENLLSVLSPSDYTVKECQVLDVAPLTVLVMLPDFATVYLERPKGIKIEVGNTYRILFFQERSYWM